MELNYSCMFLTKADLISYYFTAPEGHLTPNATPSPHLQTSHAKPGLTNKENHEKQ